MYVKCLINPSEYHDSVTLMETARELTRLPGVVDAAVVMATEANKAILDKAGLFVPAIESATSNDLVVVVRAESEMAAQQALQAAGDHLSRRAQSAPSETTFQPRTLRGAIRSNTQANLVVISLAGRYASAEAWDALRNGLHVLLFSDNVPIEDEIALKQYAVEHDLFMMGPDCGTAIIDGVALGFANAVPRGPVGIVAAAGTGLQEASTLLAKMGIGITQGIGTGGRDLKTPVGGLMMRQGIKALQSDPDTQVLLLISKPPAATVARRVLEQVSRSDKPAVVCFLGGDPGPIAEAGAIPARTLQEAAHLAAAQIDGTSVDEILERETADLEARAVELEKRLKPEQKYLRGLFSGGTLATEALIVWQEIVGDVYSNVALRPALQLQDAAQSTQHCAIDLGEDEFTIGRLHPMLDNDLRIRRLMQEAADPQVAAIMLDVVLGYGVHPDPAAELGPAILQARTAAAKAGRELLVVASVTGTKHDPQDLNRQVQTLEAAGAIVASCNAAAARLAGFLVRGRS